MDVISRFAPSGPIIFAPEPLGANQEVVARALDIDTLTKLMPGTVVTVVTPRCIEWHTVDERGLCHWQRTHQIDLGAELARLRSFPAPGRQQQGGGSLRSWQQWPSDVWLVVGLASLVAVLAIAAYVKLP